MLSAAGILQKHKFENCMPTDRQSWGFRRNAAYADYRTVSEIIMELVQTVRFHCILSILHIACYFVLSFLLHLI